MIDQYGRKIEYMRISITDRCNLRCRYCMPEEGLSCMDSEELLTYEEICKVVKTVSKLGIKKIKITGGEPLVRKGVVSLVETIKNTKGIEEVTMTSNGILLEDMAYELKKAGLDSINISLDTLDRDKYKEITRFDRLDSVLMGIQKALEVGIKTKINLVPIKGFNEDELIPIAKYAKDYEVNVRFIEIMPIGLGKQYVPIPNGEVLKRLEDAFGKGEKTNARLGNGPASYYRFKDFLGCSGFISAMTDEFCGNCNRIRMTAGGELKLCLHHNKGIDLKPLLRSKSMDDNLLQVLQDAIYKKPGKHCFLDKTATEVEERNMVQIGG